MTAHIQPGMCLLVDECAGQVWVNPHPSLALRGLRFSLAERQLFETQLRAIVQVAQKWDVRVLFPMVVGHHDLSRACAALDDVLHDLGVSRRPLLGAMVETPAALFALEEILGLVDFLAIGTNDLTQYMLALDREDAELSEECTPWHPVVRRAIRRVIEAAAVKGCPICVCGEEAGEPDFACLLAGLGVRELSLNPGRAVGVRHALRSIRCQDAEELAHKALGCSGPKRSVHSSRGSFPLFTSIGYRSPRLARAGNTPPGFIATNPPGIPTSRQGLKSWVAPNQNALFVFRFADLRRPGEGKEHDFLAGHGADVVVEAPNLESGDLLDHGLHDRPLSRSGGSAPV